MASATASRRAESKGPGPKHNIEAMREAYYERIAKHDMTPLWKVMKNVVTKEPVTRCRPVIWHYSDIKRLVMESGPLISAEEAERRVLILENPGMRGESKATNTLFAGVQMILPGEVAPAHQHVSSAIRFVLDPDRVVAANDLVADADLAGLAPRRAGVGVNGFQGRQVAGHELRPAGGQDQMALGLPAIAFDYRPTVLTAIRSPSTARACCPTARRRK